MEISSTASKCTIHMSHEMSQGLSKSEDKIMNLSKYLNSLSTEMSSLQNLNWPVRKRYVGVRNEVSNNY